MDRLLGKSRKFRDASSKISKSPQLLERSKNIFVHSTKFSSTSNQPVMDLIIYATSLMFFLFLYLISKLISYVSRCFSASFRYRIFAFKLISLYSFLWWKSVIKSKKQERRLPAPGWKLSNSQRNSRRSKYASSPRPGTRDKFARASRGRRVRCCTSWTRSAARSGRIAPSSVRSRWGSWKMKFVKFFWSPPRLRSTYSYLTTARLLEKGDSMLVRNFLYFICW